MTASNLIRAAIVMFLCAPVASAAQNAGAAAAAASGGAAAGAGREATAAEARTAERPVVWFEAGFSTGFESNLEHDETNVRSFGFVPGLAFHFQDRPSSPSLELDYEVASNSYTNTERFDRVSHALIARFERRLSERWSVASEGSASFRGSSEDRDVSNQFVGLLKVNYRLSSSLRIEPFYGYRVRRYPDPDSFDQNAVNPYLGARIKQRLGDGRRLVFGYRYDWNRSKGPRYRYIRRTWDVEYTTPFLDDASRLTLDVAYKRRAYADRFVEVGDAEVPRRDGNWWVFEADWERRLGTKLGVRFGYKFERRGSNDPEKVFSAHQLAASIAYRWSW
jgi:hypothetical protein